MSNPETPEQRSLLPGEISFPQKHPPRRSLASKIAEVMALVQRVAKNGYNAQQNYRYATDADIMDCVRDAMAQRHVVLYPDMKDLKWENYETKSGGRQRLCTLTIRYTLEDGETGEKREFDIFSQGQDSGDKAVYKAMTGATKFALQKLFLIPTGDDPENDGKKKEANKATQTEKVPPPKSQRQAPAPPSQQTQPAQPKAEPPQPPSPLRARVSRLFHTLQAVKGWRDEEVRDWVSHTVGAKGSKDWSEEEVLELERRLNREPA